MCHSTFAPYRSWHTMGLLIWMGAMHVAYDAHISGAPARFCFGISCHQHLFYQFVYWIHDVLALCSVLSWHHLKRIKPQRIYLYPITRNRVGIVCQITLVIYPYTSLHIANNHLFSLVCLTVRLSRKHLTWPDCLFIEIHLYRQNRFIFVLIHCNRQYCSTEECYVFTL